jgi:hypothetical protein
VKKGGMIFLQILFISLNVAGMTLMGIRLFQFLKLEGFNISIQNQIIICSILGCFFQFLFMFDPYGYHRSIENFAFLIITTNTADLFTSVSLILISYYLAKVILKIVHRENLNIIALITAIALVAGYVAVWILSLVVNLTNSTYKISGTSIEKYRLSIAAAIAFYLVLCTGFFVHKLRLMWAASSKQKKTKEIQYKRLIAATSSIWFVVSISVILRVLILFPKYFYYPVPNIAIVSSNAGVTSLLAICYFYLFKPREKGEKTSRTGSSRPNSVHENNNRNTNPINDVSQGYDKFDN